jgi:hypothetical protein
LTKGRERVALGQVTAYATVLEQTPSYDTSRWVGGTEALCCRRVSACVSVCRRVLVYIGVCARGSVCVLVGV